MTSVPASRVDRVLSHLSPSRSMSDSESKGVALVTAQGNRTGHRAPPRGGRVHRRRSTTVSSNSAILDTLVAEITRFGRKSSAHVADVSEAEQVEAMVAAVMVAKWGIAGAVEGAAVELSADEWYKMIKQGRGGRIIGAASIAAKKAIPAQGVYSASKFAVRGLTQAAAQEFGPHGVTVNAFRSGSCRYEHATPEDIANLVSFLASKESGFITGQSISINGGMFFD
ncbi:acetoin reductase family protein [Mycena olivaceomarginata]|nr:acetoin reductase family protein [Mycena olivaceomarginata]